MNNIYHYAFNSKVIHREASRLARTNADIGKLATLREKCAIKLRWDLRKEGKVSGLVFDNYDSYKTITVIVRNDAVLWRMPSKEDFEELQNTDNCTWDETTENGVEVYKVTSTKNGNSIVLPALSPLTMRSNYWTSTSGGNCYAYQATPFYVEYFDTRDVGRHIRPVTD